MSPQSNFCLLQTTKNEMRIKIKSKTKMSVNQLSRFLSILAFVFVVNVKGGQNFRHFFCFQRFKYKRKEQYIRLSSRQINKNPLSNKMKTAKNIIITIYKLSLSLFFFSHSACRFLMAFRVIIFLVRFEYEDEK